MDPSLELVDLVDLEDRVLGQVTRGRVRGENLLHRGVSVLVWNGRGELFVHRRTDTKDVFPGLHDLFVAGVVGAGETYAEAARREAQEELSIVGPRPEELFRYLYQGPACRAWTGVFQLTWDGPVVPQASEVAWGAFLPLDVVQERLLSWPFVPDGLEVFREWERRGLRPPGS